MQFYFNFLEILFNIDTWDAAIPKILGYTG